MRKRLVVMAAVLGIVITLRGESEESGERKPGEAPARLKKLEGAWD